MVPFSDRLVQVISGVHLSQLQTVSVSQLMLLTSLRSYHDEGSIETLDPQSLGIHPSFVMGQECEQAIKKKQFLF